VCGGGKEEWKCTVHTSASCSVEGGDETRRDERALPFCSGQDLGVFFFSFLHHQLPTLSTKYADLVLVPKPFSLMVSKIQHSWKIIELVFSLCMWVRERERERERERHTHTHTQELGWGGQHMFLVQNYDGQFGVGGILV
jgi:hypothetical protein